MQRNSLPLRLHLDALVASADRRARRDADPVGLVHEHADPDDQEVVGLVAASLAFGNVTTIRRSARRVIEALGPAPAAAIDAGDERRWRARLAGFRHRTWTGAHVARLLARAGRLRREHGRIGAFAATRLARSADVRVGLTDLADALRGPRPDRGLSHLVPDPRRGSACKRLLLYLRWMVRPADGVDLGLWDVPASRLVIPLDTHVHRIARNLGLTRRRAPSFRAAEEITDHLRRLDPDDPVKYDFAICHLGVSRDCPSRRDPVRCARCVLRPVCLAHRSGRGSGQAYPAAAPHAGAQGPEPGRDFDAGAGPTRWHRDC